MAFVKLLLILAALSFARNTVRPKIRATQTKGNIYYYALSADKDGVITYDLKDLKNGTDFEPESLSKKIEDYKPIIKDTTEKDEKFLPVEATEAAFDALLTSKELTAEERTCSVIPAIQLSNLYGLLGYTVKAVVDVDLAPSITHIIKNGPKKVALKNVPEGREEQYTDDVFDQDCNDLDGVAYALAGPLKAGVVDTKCVPNTAVPSDGSKCTTDAKYKAYLKGYRYGSFVGDSTTVKQLLIRFGAVSIDGAYIIVGWEKVGEVDNWILAVPTYEGDDEEDDDSLLYGYGWILVPISEIENSYAGGIFFNGVSAIRAALGLIVAVLVLPALLL